MNQAILIGIGRKVYLKLKLDEDVIVGFEEEESYVEAGQFKND